MDALDELLQLRRERRSREYTIDPIDVPGKRPGLLSRLARGASRVALEPLIPAEKIAKLSERLPKFGEPSERLGQLASTLAEPLTREEGLRRHFAGKHPSFKDIYEADPKTVQLGPIAPREVVKTAAEFGPSALDFATGGASKVLGLGLLAAGSLRDVSRGAGEAKKMASILDDLKMLEKASAKGEKAMESAKVTADIGQLGHQVGTETRIGRILGTPEGRLIPLETTLTSGKLASGGRQAEIVGEASKSARPILEVGPGGVERQRKLKSLIEDQPLQIEYKKPPAPPAVMTGEGVSRPEVAVAQVFRTPDDFLREIAGKQMVPREAAEGLANAARNLQHDTQVKANEGAASLDGLLRGLKRMRGDDRVRVERALATRLDFGVPTGSDELDNLADQIDGWQRTRFTEVADALEASGKPRPQPRQFYLMHHNERLGDAIRKYEANPQGAVDDVEMLYRESKVEPPARDEIKGHLDRLYREHLQSTGGKLDRIASKSQHVEEARTLDVPGYLADVRRKDFKSGDLVRTLEAYNQETAFRLSDIKSFGADGEAFKGWHDAIGNESVRQYAREYRQHLVNALSDDPLMAESNNVLGAIRSYQAANKLGRAAIANFFQTAATTLPRSVNQVGFKGLTNYADAFARSIPSLLDEGEKLAAARRAGAVYDHSVADIAGIGHKGVMGALADWQLKAFGFVPTERFNNTVSFHAGRAYAEDLAEAFQKGNRKAADEARRLLAATPEMADEYLRQATAGQPIADEILDRMGFEFARATQFRADPTTLPLKWVTPYGKTVFQFKNFGYQYSRFLQKDIFGPALNGNVAPLTVWMAQGGLTGPAITWGRKIAKDPLAVKRLLDEDPKEQEKFKSAINLDVALQAFGLWGDLVNSLRRTFVGDDNGRKDYTSMAEFAAGPTLGEGIRIPKEAVVYKEPVQEIAARRLPIGPLVPLAENLARGIELPTAGQGDALDELLERRRAARLGR